MARQQRKVIAISETTGERREFPSGYVCAKALGVTYQAVQMAQNLCGACRGWKIYDTPEKILERIEELKNQLQIVENL